MLSNPRIRAALADALDAPSDDNLWRKYVQACDELGIEPIPRERARALMHEWMATVESSRQVKH